MYATVVLPAFNEEDCIGGLLREIRAQLDHTPVREIVLVDDGSTDATAARAIAAWKGVNSSLRIVRHARRLGQSRALLTGVRAASHDLIVTLDADGQNDPADFGKLFAAYAARQARFPRLMIAGQRRRRQDSLLRRLSSRIANGVRAAILADNVRDTGCSLKLFRRDDFLALPFFDHIHRFIPAMMKATGVAIALVEVGHRPRQAGRSKYGLFDRLWVGIHDLIGVHWLIKRQIADVEWEDVL
jgi:dolichol-phosphate mannosyltransferase